MSISRKLLQTQSGVAPEVVSWTLTKAITERRYSVGDGGGLYVGDIDTPHPVCSLNRMVQNSL
jgi:hypothetical protein